MDLMGEKCANRQISKWSAPDDSLARQPLPWEVAATLAKSICVD